MSNLFGEKTSGEVRFRIYGIPRSAGSKRGFFNKKLNRVMIVDANKNAGTWKQEVKEEAFKVVTDVPTRAAVELTITFILPRPKGHYGTGRNEGTLKPSAPTKHTKKPDATKLLRGTEDALKGILWADDSQVWKTNVRKIYGERPGAEITVQWGEE